MSVSHGKLCCKAKSPRRAGWSSMLQWFEVKGWWEEPKPPLLAESLLKQTPGSPSTFDANQTPSQTPPDLSAPVPSCTPESAKKPLSFHSGNFKADKDLRTWSSKSYLSALSWSFCPILQHVEHPMVHQQESGDRGEISNK